MSVRIRARKKLRDFELDVDVTMADGEILVLLGENGAGKTTLLRIVAGLTSPDQGRITVGEEVFFDSASGIDRPSELRNTGYMFQGYALFPHMTVLGNLTFGLRLRGESEGAIEERLRPFLRKFGLEEVLHTKAGKLSGGQRQRVALLRAMALRPSIFLLDEPVSAIDPTARPAMRKAVRNIARDLGRPTIVVTHDLRDAVEMGDRLCVMDHGRVVASGRPEEVLAGRTDGRLDGFLLPGCRCGSTASPVIWPLGTMR